MADYEFAALMLDRFQRIMLDVYTSTAPPEGVARNMSMLRWSASANVPDGCLMQLFWRQGNTFVHDTLAMFALKKGGWVCSCFENSEPMRPFAESMDSLTERAEISDLTAVGAADARPLLEAELSSRKTALSMSMWDNAAPDQALVSLAQRMFHAGRYFYGSTVCDTSCEISLASASSFGVQELRAHVAADQRQGAPLPSYPFYQAVVRPGKPPLVQSGMWEIGPNDVPCSPQPLWPKSVARITLADLETGTLGHELDNVIGQAFPEYCCS